MAKGFDPTPEEQDQFGHDEAGDPFFPCPPEAHCPKCAPYWARMREEGFWDEDEGWTDKAMKEWMK